MDKLQKRDLKKLGYYEILVTTIVTCLCISFKATSLIDIWSSYLFSWISCFWYWLFKLGD